MPRRWYGLPLREREEVYRRQFSETAGLRRYIYGFLPLRRARIIIEPGCGTGLILEEVSSLSEASLTGYDRETPALVIARSRVPALETVECDIEKHRFRNADIVLLSHVLLELSDPGRFLRRLRRCLIPGGRLAVLGEYDWLAATEEPGGGLLDRVRTAMADDGLKPDTAGEMESLLNKAGFRIDNSGIIEGPLAPLDSGYLASLAMDSASRHCMDALRSIPATAPLVSVPVRWAVCTGHD